MSHILRLSAPKRWPIMRKEGTFSVRPMPGAHSFENGISLNIILKNLLGYAKTRREVRGILNKKEILVDSKRRKDDRFLVGIMDIIEIKELGEYYRLVYNKKGKFVLNKISAEEAKIKVCKIVNKTMLKGKKIQYQCYDNRIFIDKTDYKIGDSVVVDIEKNKIKEHLKFEKGAVVYLIGGSYIGNVGTVDEIQKTDVIFTIENKKDKTRKKYCYVIGKNKPVINLEK